MSFHFASSWLVLIPRSVVKESDYYYLYQGKSSLQFPYHIVLKEYVCDSFILLFF
jgi:hypothetical protein